jgi:hypothetical protein
MYREAHSPLHVYYPLVHSIWCSDHWRPPESVEMTSTLVSVAMTFGGALIEEPRNATTTISVQIRSHGRLLCTFCNWFSLQIDRGMFYVKR